MASKARCFLFLILVFSFCIQINARESKFFNKLSKEMINHESITISPIQAPILAPSPSPQSNDEEHGYGLYGQDPYENYEYPPTTTNPTKTTRFGEEKFVSTQEEFSKNNFKEFETSYGNGNGYGNGNENGYGNGNENGNGNGNGNGKQGMSDTRYMENGKYFYDVSNEEGENVHFKINNYENGNVEEKKQGMSDTRFLDNEEGKSGEFEVNNNENNENEKKGMSDTRFFENGKYYYDVNNENKKNNEDVGFHNNNNVEYANSYYENGNGNGNGNENEKNEFEKFDNEKKGMSDTRFLENGKYYYNVDNENKNNENLEFHNNNNVEYANSYYENGNGNGNEKNGYETQGKEGYENGNGNEKNGYETQGKEGYENGNGNGNEKNGYETQGREGYDYKHSNEFHAKEGRGRYNYPKKFPNEYDTMEEYDREQGYIDGQDHYVP